MLSPGAFLATRLDVHEPTLGLGFLAMTLSAGLTGQRLSRSWWWPVLAAACRIEMAAATIIAGLLFLRSPQTRKLGVMATMVGFGGLVLSLLLIWRSRSDAVSLTTHLAHLGSTPLEVVSTAVTRPLEILKPLGNPTMLSSLAVWLLPMGLVLPLLGWRCLLVALPMAGVAIFGVWAPADHYVHHYWYGFLVTAPFGALVGLRRKPHLQKVFVSTALVGLVIAWIGFGPALSIMRPFGRTASAPLREMVRYVSEHGMISVSAPDYVVPHLVGRVDIYPFPRPFQCSEESIGPFRVSGVVPELVLVPRWDQQQVESDPVTGPILATHYVVVPDHVENAAYRLKETGLSGLGCVEQ
jgi:hypothetical protein